LYFALKIVESLRRQAKEAMDPWHFFHCLMYVIKDEGNWRSRRGRTLTSALRERKLVGSNDYRTFRLIENVSRSQQPMRFIE
jgi:hypothetical protein